MNPIITRLYWQITALLLASHFAGVFAGDIVAAKKPPPDIYNHAMDALGLSPKECVVVEDSRNGLLAATAAGLACVITTNALTEQENFSEAELVVRSRGDPGEPVQVLINRSPACPVGMITVEDLEAILMAPS